MGFVSMMKTKLRAQAVERQRQANYRKEADRIIKRKAEASYYKAREQQAIKEAQNRAKEEGFNSGGFGQKLKTGIKKSVKEYGKYRKKHGLGKSSPMGLKRVNQSGPGPQFGLSNSSAFDIKVNKKGKGPFDL